MIVFVEGSLLSFETCWQMRSLSCWLTQDQGETVVTKNSLDESVVIYHQNTAINANAQAMWSWVWICVGVLTWTWLRSQGSDLPTDYDNVRFCRSFQGREINVNPCILFYHSYIHVSGWGMLGNLIQCWRLCIDRLLYYIPISVATYPAISWIQTALFKISIKKAWEENAEPFHDGPNLGYSLEFSDLVA